MTLQEFARDIVPILSLVVSTLGLISLFLLWWQIRQTAVWNKLQSQYSFRDSPTFAHRRRVVEATEAVGVDTFLRVAPLEQDELERLWQDKNAYWAIFDYMNDLETACTALRLGSIDPEVAYAEYSSPVIRGFSLFRPWIEKVRRHYNDDELYYEIERVAHLWAERDAKNIQAREAAAAKLEARQRAELGVKRKV